AGQVSDAADVTVLAGTDDLTNFSDPPAVNVVASEIAFDPLYDPDLNTHDVAVITLSAPLWAPDPPPSNIQPITAISSTDWDNIASGDNLVVSGFGDESAEPADGPGNQIFSDTLQSANVPFVAPATCASDYAAAGVTVDTSLLFCAGDHNFGAGITDSCQGDSGGPIVSGSPGSFVLVGLVDSGIGCAQSGFPGIYTQMVDSGEPHDFAFSDHTRAPSQPGGQTTISGGNQPGQTLTCATGAWSDPAAVVTYQFFNTSGQELTSASAGGTTYTIQNSDRGSDILCEVKATGEGGYGYADSSTVSVPAPVVITPPPPPPAQKDTTAPRLRVRSKKCTRTTCTVKVKVTDSGFSTGISKVNARLNYTRLVSCRKHGKKAKCKRRAHKTLHASRGKGNIFTIVARHLKPGTGYSFSLLPFDKAGNKPTFSTITNVRTQRRHRRGFAF
ncbi:MAG TPA: serine protease, partial [Thermoleophilaceae bacterium]